MLKTVRVLKENTPRAASANFHQLSKDSDQTRKKSAISFLVVHSFQFSPLLKTKK
uniref:Uncharacterized protein n=1 Tax=Arundo donax TaxID=35708 RepID=A0A0A9E226_ARUDO